MSHVHGAGCDHGGSEIDLEAVSQLKYLHFSNGEVGQLIEGMANIDDSDEIGAADDFVWNRVGTKIH